MCARITTTEAEIADLFGLTHDGSRSRPLPRANAPAMRVPAIRVVNGTRELAELRWGLVPFWNTNPKHTGFVTARAETAPGKPAFHDPFRWRRCLVPADGFFEWETTRKKKRPYYFRKAGGGVLVYAGLWDRWKGPAGPVETVVVLTVPANDRVRPFRDRMPAILRDEHWDAWLDPNESRPSRLRPLLEPCPADRMEHGEFGEPDRPALAPEPPAPAWFGAA